MQRVLYVIVGCFVFRLIMAAILPLDLVHDEAYYWDWSRHLDWCYYSKPPMVAWLIALSTAIFGDTTWAVRLPAVCLGTWGTLFIFLLARDMFGSHAGFWSAVLSLATPGSSGIGLITLTLAIGLGLLSKQTMLLFLMLGGLFVLSSREDRVELRRPALWLCGLTSLCFLAPVLWWNISNGWVTLEHTSGHFAHEQVTLLRRITQFLEFAGSQFAVMSSVTCWLFCTASLLGLASFWRSDQRPRVRQ